MAQLIVVTALTRNGVIGVDNKLPWGNSLPRDMARFKTLTERCGVVLMGRKTADSLPKPLVGRRNLVLSRSQLKGRPGFEHFATLKQAIASCPANQMIAVIGGAEIYRMCAPYATRGYFTLVDVELPGDAIFPHDAYASFERVGASVRHAADENNAHDMHFVTTVNEALQPLT